jgi:hypothetical protein
MKINLRAFSIEARLIVLCILLTTSCGIVSARQNGPVWHQIEDKRPRADRAWAIARSDVLEIRVEHRGGISKTQFVLKEGEWPSKLQFAFHHFKALEGLKVRTDTDKFEGSVSFSNKQPVIELGQGFTAKKKGECIYIYGPHRFVKKSDESIYIEWVDFYRN